MIFILLGKMHLNEAIDYFGGKTGQLVVLKKAIPELPIRKLAIRRKGDPINDLERQMQDIEPPYILRGSNKHDHFNLEGIIPSYPNKEWKGPLTTFDVISYLVELLEWSWDDHLFKDYESIYGEKDHTIHSLVMHMNPSKTRLVALRHPHNRDLIHMELAEIESSRIKRTYLVLQYNTKEETFHFGNDKKEVRLDFIANCPWMQKYGGDHSADNLTRIVDIIKAVEQSGEVTPGFAQYFEFCFNDLELVQVRPFMEYSEPTFPIDPTSMPKQFRADMCFRQTPPTGTSLPFITSGNPDKEYSELMRNGVVPNTPEYAGGLTHLEFTGISMSELLVESKRKYERALAILDTDPAVLSHNLYRLMKRSEVTLIGPQYQPQQGEYMLFVSNGVHGFMVPDSGPV